MGGVNGIDSHAPEKKPNMMAKMIVPAASFTASAQKLRMAQAATHGMTTLNTPKRPTIKLGTIRPTVLAVLRTANYIQEVIHDKPKR